MTRLPLIISVFFAFSGSMVFGQTPTDSAKMIPRNEMYILTKYFIKDSYVNLSNDSIVFTLTTDSTIVADNVWTHDTTKVWVYYKNHGMNDFWASYRPPHTPITESLPKKFINEYFKDKGIKLFETFIYFSGTPHIRDFLACGSCYQGTDFLFKIKLEDFQYLSNETHQKMILLNSNYR